MSQMDSYIRESLINATYKCMTDQKHSAGVIIRNKIVKIFANQPGQHAEARAIEWLRECVICL
jgi:hypothetical protein